MASSVKHGRRQPALWRCPECGEQFTTRRQWHACGVFDLEALFARSDPAVRRLYERFRRIVEECGPVRVIPQKSRIAFQARMRFAALMPRRKWLNGHLVLGERHESPCFENVQSMSRRNHLHVFRLHTEAQLNEEFRRYLQAAYRVGLQEHVRRGRVEG